MRIIISNETDVIYLKSLYLFVYICKYDFFSGENVYMEILFEHNRRRETMEI